MGLLERHKDFLAEQARLLADGVEAIRKADKAQSDALALQERAAAEINLKQVTEFLPLLKALNAKKELQDLVKLWEMGRVDKVPQYVPDGNYASLAWRKSYWNYEAIEKVPSILEGGVDWRYGTAIRDVIFAIHVRKSPVTSFRTVALAEAYKPWKKTSEWQEFPLSDYTAADSLLVETMLKQEVSLGHPGVVLSAARHQYFPSGGYSQETPIRHPILLRLGFPDFDLHGRK